MPYEDIKSKGDQESRQLKEGETTVQLSHFEGFPGVDGSDLIKVNIPGFELPDEQIPRLQVISADKIVDAVRQIYDEAVEDGDPRKIKRVCAQLIENIRSEVKQESMETLKSMYTENELTEKVTELRNKYLIFSSIITQLRQELVDVLGVDFIPETKLGMMLQDIQRNLNILRT